MCDTCSALRLDRCPPRNRGAPDPAVVAERTADVHIEHHLRALGHEVETIDAVTALVLRARLEAPGVG